MRVLGTHAYRSNRLPICRYVAGAVTLLASTLIPGCLSPTPEKAVRSTTVPSPQLSVAILDLEDTTGARESAHWRYASGLLRTSLKKVAALHILPDEAVWRAWHRVGVQAGAPLDPNLLRRIGEEAEAQRVVWGRYSGKDRQWQVALRIVNVATGGVSAELAASGSDWYDLRDRLNEQILSELGVVPSAPEKERMAKRETRSPEALECCLQVHHLQQEGRPVSEMEMLSRKAVAADPNFILARVFLANTLVNQGKFDLAEDLMQRTVQLDPDSASVHAALAGIFLAQQRWDQAEAEYRRACRLNPGDAESLVWLAVCCDKKGKRDESLSLLEKAVALDRTAALAHAHLADAYAVRKRQEEALRELEEARFYLPEGIVAGNALLIMGNAYESLGRHPEAIECWERTLAVAKGMALDPDTNRFVERRIRRVKSAFRPTYVEAAMPKRYTPETLDRALQDTLSEAERRLVADPFSCTPPMKEWARELTRGATTDLDKAKAIFYGLAARPLVPGQPQSRTARQVFEAWNQAGVRLVCMDHAVLFVALARAVDVNAFFVNVTADPDGNVKNHACAVVFTPGGTLLADSSLGWFGAPHRQYQILDDLQTTAFLCFNNTEANPQELATCRAGLKLWPDSVQGQLSLVGALHHAHPEEARRVLADIREPRAGSYEAAIYWRLRGIFAMDEHDWERAETYLLKAISAYPGDAGTHFGLGTLYLQQRRFVEARTAFRACLRDGPPPTVVRAAHHCIAQINEKISFDVPVKQRWDHLAVAEFAGNRPILRDTAVIVAGPLTLDLYISKTANLFHAVDQIAQWSEFCHTQYVPYFQGLEGGISEEDQDLLAQHCAIRRVHGWGGGLEQTFYTSDDLETALARGVQEGHLSREEAQKERRILTHFQDRVERLMTAEAPTLQRFVQQLQARKPDLVTFADDISRFVGGAQITVPVFLMANPDEYTCGGGVSGGRLTIEIGGSCDAYPILLHELFHAFVQTKQELIQRAARAVPGLNVETLGEGLAHAYSPGLFPAADSDQTDQLSTMVAGFRAQGLSLQDARTRFRSYGLALRPLLKDALSDKRQTLETFLPRATDAWLVLTELEKARGTKSASQTHDYRKDPKHSIFIFGNADREASDALFKTSHRHFWGREHVADQYQEMLTKNAKPGDAIILLLSLDDHGRMPAEFSDLLPSSWTQVESLLQQGQTVFQQGRARDMDIFLLAAPTARILRTEFRRLVTEGKFVLDSGARPK